MKLFNKAMSTVKTVDAPAVEVEAVNEGVTSSEEVSTEAAESVAEIILE